MVVMGILLTKYTIGFICTRILQRFAEFKQLNKSLVENSRLFYRCLDDLSLVDCHTSLQSEENNQKKTAASISSFPALCEAELSTGTTLPKLSKVYVPPESELELSSVYAVCGIIPLSRPATCPNVE